MVEKRQPHMRGGAHEPLSRDDIERKFAANVAFGGWSIEAARSLRQAVARVASGGPVELARRGD